MPTARYTLLLALLTTLFLASCEDSKPKSAPVVQPEIKRYTQDTVLQGTVNNNRSVIKNGTVVITDTLGRILKQTTVKGGHFQISIPKGTALPLLLRFSTLGMEPLISVVIHDKVTRYYINPNTTAIAKAAQAMGGYTRANLDRAAENTLHVPEGNKTTTGWRGDPTQQYGGWH